MLKLMFITNNPQIAKNAVKAGVNRIFVDIERNGKFERQRNKDAYISDHTLKDVPAIREIIPDADLMVRVNPMYENSKMEIERCIEMGVDVIMLPMFKSAEEVRNFISIINGRAKTCLLLETPQALTRIDSILKISGIDEIHVGLNDLHLGMGLDFMFEILSGGLLDYMAEKVRSRDITFGFGGVAKLGQGIIPAEQIIGEHYRIGSKMAILSRSFREDAEDYDIIHNEINKIRAFEIEVQGWTMNEIQKNRERICQSIDNYLLTMKK